MRTAKPLKLIAIKRVLVLVSKPFKYDLSSFESKSIAKIILPSFDAQNSLTSLHSSLIFLEAASRSTTLRSSPYSPKDMTIKVLQSKRTCILTTLLLSSQIFSTSVTFATLSESLKLETDFKSVLTTICVESG